MDNIKRNRIPQKYHYGHAYALFLAGIISILIATLFSIPNIINVLYFGKTNAFSGVSLVFWIISLIINQIIMITFFVKFLNFEDVTNVSYELFGGGLINFLIYLGVLILTIGYQIEESLLISSGWGIIFGILIILELIREKFKKIEIYYDKIKIDEEEIEFIKVLRINEIQPSEINEGDKIVDLELKNELFSVLDISCMEKSTEFLISIKLGNKNIIIMPIFKRGLFKKTILSVFNNYFLTEAFKERHNELHVRERLLKEYIKDNIENIELVEQFLKDFLSTDEYHILYVVRNLKEIARDIIRLKYSNQSLFNTINHSLTNKFIEIGQILTTENWRMRYSEFWESIEDLPELKKEIEEKIR